MLLLATVLTLLGLVALLTVVAAWAARDRLRPVGLVAPSRHELERGRR